MNKSNLWLPSLALCVALGLCACNSSASSKLNDPNSNTSGELVFTPVSNAGRLLASNCFQCHGTNGQNGAFDSLAGESAREIIEEMNELKTKTDLDEAIMKVHALGYTDAQVKLIADFFSKVQR